MRDCAGRDNCYCSKYLTGLAGFVLLCCFWLVSEIYIWDVPRERGRKERVREVKIDELHVSRRVRWWVVYFVPDSVRVYHITGHLRESGFVEATKLRLQFEIIHKVFKVGAG